MTTDGIKEPLLLTIAVLGGTGKEGKGLAYRWAKAGYKVLIGSRSEERAVTAASEIMELAEGSTSIVGTTNKEAAQLADIVVLTVPLVPPKVTTVQMPSAGSAAQEAKEIVGEGVEVVAAFHSISHEHLLKDDYVESEVLVTGTSKDARAEVIKLVEAAGLTGWDAGPIENSVVLEGLTSVLIYINKQYGSTHAGIKITGASNKQ